MAHTPELEKLERRYDEDPAKWFAQLAEAYRKYQRTDDALAILNNHLQDRPNYVSALIVLGRCHLDKQTDAEARSAFERVLAIDPENIIALKVLGEVAERAGDTDEARSWLTRLLDVDPANDEAQASLDRLGGPAAAPAPPAPAAAAPEASFGDLSADLDPEATVDGFEPTAAAPPPPPLDVVREGDQLPVPEAAEDDPEGIPLERASVEVSAATVELEPLDLEQVGEADLPDPEHSTGPESSAVEIGEVELEPFDDALQWGTGERQSREITADDVAEAEAAHDEIIDHAAVEELPGLAGAEVPPPETAHEVAAVEGLVDEQVPEDLEPAPGFEPTAVAPGEAPAPDAVPDLVADMAPEALATPAVEPEPPVEPATPDRGPEVEERGSLAGLPVILPDDEEDVPPAPPVAVPAPAARDVPGRVEEAEAEPEPVVTETMAELYVRQGLLDEACAVYEQLLAARPGDARLLARLAELRAPAPRYAAADTGGPSARHFLQSILDGQAVDLPAPTPSPPPVPDPHPEPAPAPAMEDAFAAEPLTPRGQPTRPASSSYTLGQVFGEESPAPSTAPPRGQGGSGGSGFSFDEFFAGGPKPAARPSTGAGGEDDDSFREWLKGLKK